jgi:hypothetical protein
MKLRHQARRSIDFPTERALGFWQSSCVCIALALSLVALSCGGGGDEVIQQPLHAMFIASGTPAAPNMVRLVGGNSAGNTVSVKVSVGGPTTSSDIYSFAFDLILSDGSIARYVPGSGVFGPALQLDAAQGQGGTVLVTQMGNRVVVGVSKTGGGAGNGIGNGEDVIVALTFEILKKGTTDLFFGGSPSNPMNPTADPSALDSAGMPIVSVSFDGARAQLIGQG